MRRFAELCERVAATSAKNEKVDLVAAYLRSVPVEEARHAALFLCGRVFPRREERTLSIGGATIWEIVLKIAGVPEKRLQAVYRTYGDLGDMAEEVLQAHLTENRLSVRDLAHALDRMSRMRAPSQRQAALEELLRSADALVAKYVIKIITGDLRIGLKEGLVEEAIARAYGVQLDQVRRANMLTGDIGETLQLAAQGALEQARLTLFRPIAFMLANPIDSAEQAVREFPNGALVEDKYDGVRVQLHKCGREVRLYSRTLDEVREFHELYPHVESLPGDFILDGEVVAWRDGKALPFHELQKRLGRKEPHLWLALEVPVTYFVFDLLYLDGDELLDRPLAERRERLEVLLRDASSEHVQLTPAKWANTAEDFEAAFREALERGNEGLMIKDPQAPYLPGTRGRHWLKWKQPLATLDVVVTAVEYGHGKRRGLLSDYTFAVRAGDRFVDVGKAYSGLTDDEIRQLTDFFLRHTIQDLGFRRRVEPKVVLEVAFNNIQRSSRHESGYALRFPRIVRLRLDKRPEEVDTIERVEEIFRRQFERGPQ